MSWGYLRGGRTRYPDSHVSEPQRERAGVGQGVGGFAGGYTKLISSTAHQRLCTLAVYRYPGNVSVAVFCDVRFNFRLNRFCSMNLNFYWRGFIGSFMDKYLSNFLSWFRINNFIFLPYKFLSLIIKNLCDCFLNEIN